MVVDELEPIDAEDIITEEEFFKALKRMSKDLKQAAATLSEAEVRFLVDYYYQMQEDRKRAKNQQRAGGAAGEPHRVISWLTEGTKRMEGNVKLSLGAYAESKPVGRWLFSITGIGPVISAGLMAHTHIEHCPTVGHLWRFAGLDPTVEWLGTEKAKSLVRVVMGSAETATPLHLEAVAAYTHRRAANIEALARDDEADGRITRKSLEAALARRPWDGKLKTLAWKIGESFVKFSNHPSDSYGRVWRERKGWEWTQNLAGAYTPQATAKLRDVSIGRDKDAYHWYAGHITPQAAADYREALDAAAERHKAAMDAYEVLKARAVEQGLEPGPKPAAEAVRVPVAVAGPGRGVPMLPPGHIHSRAKRYAVKLFLSHYHEVAYYVRYNQMPPKPYILEHGTGVHAHFRGVPNARVVPGLKEAEEVAFGPG